MSQQALPGLPEGAAALVDLADDRSRRRGAAVDEPQAVDQRVQVGAEPKLPRLAQAFAQPPSQHGLAGHVPEIVEPAAQPLDGGRIFSALERLFGIFQRRPRFAGLAADGKGPQTDARDREQQPGRQARQSLRLAAAPFPPALGKTAVGHSGQRQIGKVAPRDLRLTMLRRHSDRAAGATGI